MFRELAALHGIEFHFVESLEHEETLNTLHAMKPDLVLCLFWGAVVQESAIECVRLGFVNLHGGLLPRFRGNACANWAILTGQDEMGVSIHYMDGGKLDSGPILAQATLPITQTTVVEELFEGTMQVGGALIVDMLRDLESGIDPIAEPQDESKALRCYPRLPEYGMIDWSQPATQIDRHIRSLGPPYGYAYTYRGVEKIEVLKAAPVDHQGDYLAEPGHIIAIGGQGSILVATGSGVLDVQTIRRSG
ncbi:MAG: methionyl-tRNA formyltransferase, partial [Pseudomonadota bacterium]